MVKKRTGVEKTESFWTGIHENIHRAFDKASLEQALEVSLQSKNAGFSTVEQKYAHLKMLAERELGLRRQNNNSESIQLLNHLIGMLQLERGDYSSAEDTWLQKLISNHPSRPDLAALYNLAFTYEEQGRYREAEPLLRALGPLLQWKIGEASPQVLGCVRRLATCVFKQGRQDEAKDILSYAR